MESKAIVMYDEDCGFCRVSLAILLTFDRGERPGSLPRGRPSPPQLPVRWGRSAASKALRPLPLGSPEANRLLADMSPEQRDASWHLVLEDPPSPTRFSAGAALAPALSLLPGGRVPAALFARFPRATEGGYRWVAEHRGALGRFVPARARRWADRVIAAHGGPESSQ